MTLTSLIGSVVLVGAAAGSVFGKILLAGLRLRRRRAAVAVWERAWSQPRK